MTAHVVGVLAEALAQHGYFGSRLVLVGESTDDMDAYRFRISCQCGWSTLTAVSQADRPKGERDFGTLHARHQASVVGALPNIAIVPLPEPTVREYGGFSWGADEDDENPTVTATAGYDTVRLYQEDARHTSDDAVEIAGFLLAAARASRAALDPQETP